MTTLFYAYRLLDDLYLDLALCDQAPKVGRKAALLRRIKLGSPAVPVAVGVNPAQDPIISQADNQRHKPGISRA